MRSARSVFFACLAMMAIPFFSTEARADFRVCNATQSLIGVAIGYRSKDGWKTEGWWNIEASTCQTLVQGSLSSRYYYLYAEDGERGGRWDGPVSMCIAERPFNIDGVKDCFQRGFQKVGFREYDTGGQASWMVQLTDDQSTDQNATTPAPAAPSPNESGEPDGGPAAGAPDEGGAGPDAQGSGGQGSDEPGSDGPDDGDGGGNGQGGQGQN